MKTTTLKHLELDLDMMCESDLAGILVSTAKLEVLRLSRTHLHSCETAEDGRLPIHARSVMHALQSVRRTPNTFSFYTEQIEECNCGKDYMRTFTNFPRLQSLMIAPELHHLKNDQTKTVMGTSSLLPKSPRFVAFYLDTYTEEDHGEFWHAVIEEVVCSKHFSGKLKSNGLELMDCKARAKCTQCGWVNNACGRCMSEDSGECDLCYRSEKVIKMLKDCAARNVKLMGPWETAGPTRHPAYHEALMEEEEE